MHPAGLRRIGSTAPQADKMSTGCLGLGSAKHYLLFCQNTGGAQVLGHEERCGGLKVGDKAVHSRQKFLLAAPQKDSPRFNRLAACGRRLRSMTSPACSKFIAKVRMLLRR